MLIKADWTFSDHELGALVRRGIERWSDFSDYSLNEISIWEISAHGQMDFVKRVYNGLRRHNVPVKSFESFMLLKASVRKNFAAHSIFDVRSLANLSEHEVRKIVRFRESVDACGAVLAMSGLKLRPEMPKINPLLAEVKEMLDANVDFDEVARSFNITRSTLTGRLNRLKVFAREQDYVRQKISEWQNLLKNWDAGLRIER